jgi:hypothetical protein
MNVGSRFWECPCCRISGYLLDYEMYRSNCDRWKAQNAIDQAVALLRRQEQKQAEERVRQVEAQAQAIAAAYDLYGPGRRVFRIICLSPGITRGDLQRRAHLPRFQFRAALREPGTRGLIRRQVSASTGGRWRQLLFPVSDRRREP